MALNLPPRTCLCGCGATFLPKRVKQVFATRPCKYRYYNALRAAPVNKNCPVMKVCPHCGKVI